MKMKQVCQLTGLTERTIRFYVEKELCAPETRWMDQRKYYDFSKENVEELRQAAELRKAYFSIQAIQTMRSSPERIPEILKTYRQGLAADEAHKRKLLDVMEQMDVEQILFFAEEVTFSGVVSMISSKSSVSASRYSID